MVAQATGREGSIFAPAGPVLWPHMLLPRFKHAEMPFPFNDPSVRYVYLARNGIYALARELGLGGQEVLFPAYFCGVELDALLAAGVRPRFFPVSSRLRIDPHAVIDRITPQTRAIYVIHYLGFPGPVAELQRVCWERGLLFIEDCALALLSFAGDRPLGSFGDGAVFSLYKSLPTPNGGAVVMRDPRANRPSEGMQPPVVALMSSVIPSLLLNLEMHGSGAARWLRRTLRSVAVKVWYAAGKEPPVMSPTRFSSGQLKLAMSRLSHVVLRAQNFAAIVERRRRNYSYLLEQLRDLVPPVFEELPPRVCPLFYPLQVLNSLSVIARLKEQGVETLAFWGRYHPMTPQRRFPEVDHLRRTMLWLPCHQDLGLAAIARVAEVVRQIVRGG